MALVDNAWYINYGDGSAGAGKKSYWDVAQWATGTVYAAGAIIRQLAAPAVGSERCFICVVAGTSHASTEPTWTLTRGATTTDNTATWQECTGIAGLNGDLTNTPSWTISATPPGGVKNTAVTKGQVIKRDSAASYQICTTAGTAGNGSEPSFSNTAGTTTADNTVTWTSLGAVGNFTGWQAPHARCASAFTATWGVAENKFYVADNHAETQAATLNFTVPGTYGLTKTQTLCVDRAGAVPPGTSDLKTTGSITTTGAFAINLNQGGYMYGLIFNCGSGAVANVLLVRSYGTMEACSLRKNGTVGALTAINFSGNSNVCASWLKNTTMSFGNAGDSLNISAGTYLEWTDTASAVIGTTITGALLSQNHFDSGGSFKFQGLDLSGVGSGTAIISNATNYLVGQFIDCKLWTSYGFNAQQGRVDLIRCDNAGTNYNDIRASGHGLQTVETTIVRTSGATDGTTLIAWKIASNANPFWGLPFASQPIAVWNTSTSAITTLTIYGTTTGGGVPNNDDIWVEVEYLGSASTTLGSTITTTKANILAASVTTNNSSDASTWGGGGAGNGFKIVVPSFTPGQAGPLNITVKVGKASSTYYIDPLPSISGVTVSKSFALAPGVYANELSSGGGSSGMKYRNDMRGNLG